MRVLLNCFGFFKPATIITERELFLECQIALFVADMCHLDYQKKEKRPDSRYNLLSDLFRLKYVQLIKQNILVVIHIKELV